MPSKSLKANNVSGESGPTLKNARPVALKTRCVPWGSSIPVRWSPHLGFDSPPTLNVPLFSNAVTCELGACRSQATSFPVTKETRYSQAPAVGGLKWARQTLPEVAEVFAASPSAAKYPGTLNRWSPWKKSTSIRTSLNGFGLPGSRLSCCSSAKSPFNVSVTGCQIRFDSTVTEPSPSLPTGTLVSCATTGETKIMNADTATRICVGMLLLINPTKLILITDKQILQFGVIRQNLADDRFTGRSLPKFQQRDPFH